jgi:serine/threonine protein kinase
MIGKTLGHYQVVEEIGSGGMGIVYKARDLHLDRFVALKILPAERIADQERKKRFVLEAKACSALNHPNIIHIYDIGADGGVEFIVMEYVEGKTLGDRIGKRPLSLKETLKYGVQIADALAKAHSAGIIHRDLKPPNIMVNDDGVVKVLDFGLAKLTERIKYDEFASTASASVGDTPVTGAGTIIGTVAYMSPEQAEGKPIDQRSDIFSFGAILYEMITGRRAFQGDSKISTLAAVLTREPAPFGAEISRDLEKTIVRCLRKDPERRYQNMADVRVALEELKEESDSNSLASTASASRTQGTVRSIRKSVILLLVAIAVCAGVFWYYLSSQSNSDHISSPGLAPGGNLKLLVSSTGGASDPALSPDGKMLAYVAEADGHRDIFVCRVAGGERIRLTNDDAEESCPGFSPDGERIVYTRLGSKKPSPEAWVVPTFGGQATRIMENALDAVFSPDGKQLAFVLRRPGEGDVLARSAADGTNISRIMKSDGSYPFFRTPSWSPDGKYLAVTRSLGGIAGELWLVPIADGPPHRFSNDPPGISSHRPVFTPDGHGIVYESNRAGAQNLWMLPLDKRPPVRLTSGPGPDTMPAIAHNGSIAFLNARSRYSLVIHNLVTGQAREILTHSAFIWAPAFSPSGRELAYSRAEQDGAWHIWIVPVQGGAPRQLTFGSLPEIYPRFSPDGASIIYNTWSPGPDRIWRVPRTGGPPAALTPARDDDDQYADISPDGRWLAFARTENKITRVYVASVSGGQARRLVEDSSTLPRWSPDGQWIAFSRSRGRDGIFVIKADGSGLRCLSETGGWPIWWHDGKLLGYQDTGIDGSELVCTIPFAGGAHKTLFNHETSNNPFDVSPDGTLIANAGGEEVASDIWLLEPARALK